MRLDSRGGRQLQESPHGRFWGAVPKHLGAEHLPSLRPPALPETELSPARYNNCHRLNGTSLIQ